MSRAGITHAMRSRQPQPLQTRLGQHDRVELPLVELAQPRFDVAANVFDDQIGPQVQELRFAAQAAGADARGWRQRFDAGRP